MYGKQTYFGLLKNADTMTANRNYTLPDATCTVALTSDITTALGNYLPLTGGTVTGFIRVNNNQYIQTSSSDDNYTRQNAYGIRYYLSSTGNFARGSAIYVNRSETASAVLGIYGSAGVVSHMYFGDSYTSPDFKVAKGTGTVTLNGGTINSSITSTYLAANKAFSFINSTSAAGAFTSFLRGASINGAFCIAKYVKEFILTYTSQATIDANTNAVTYKAVLLNESGNSSFPGTVSSNGFVGNLSGTASMATRLKTSYIGSGAEASNGWYAVATGTLTGNDDRAFTILLESGYLHIASGIIHVHLRCNNTTTVVIQAVKWLSRFGFSKGDVIVATVENVWTMYVYRRALRYGRIGVTLLAHQGTNTDADVTLLNSETKTTETPVGVTATGGNMISPTLLYSGSGSRAVTISEASNTFEYLLIELLDSSGVQYLKAKCPADTMAISVSHTAIGMSPQYGVASETTRMASCCISIQNISVEVKLSEYIINGSTTYSADAVTHTSYSIQQIWGCSMMQ